MAYLIKTLQGKIVDGGQTRQQVIRALKQHGFIRFDQKELPPMPKHGRRLVLDNPLQMPSCFIDAV